MSAATKPMHEAAIRQYAKQLRLPTVGSQFTRLAEQAVPRHPKLADHVTRTPMGPIGVAINGVPFYNPYNAQGDDAADSGGALPGGEDAGGVRLPVGSAHSGGTAEESE